MYIKRITVEYLCVAGGKEQWEANVENASDFDSNTGLMILRLLSHLNSIEANCFEAAPDRIYELLENGDDDIPC